MRAFILSLKKMVITLVIALTATAGVQAQQNWTGYVTLTNGQVITDNITLTGSVMVTVASGTAYISGVISNATGLTPTFGKDGAGTLVLSGTNTYSGYTFVAAGKLQVGNGTSGSIENTAGVSVSAGAILRFQPSYNMSFDKLIYGDGNVEFSGGVGTKNLTFTVNNTYAGTTTIVAGLLNLGYGTATGMVAGDIINNGMLQFYRSNDVTFTKVISGTGEVVKSGTNKVILTGANVYSGITSIYGGTLQIGNGTSGSIASTFNVLLSNATSILRFEPGADMIFDKKISGSGNVEKKGGSVLYLTADNDYTGTTTNESGELHIGNNTTTGNVAGNIVNNGFIRFSRSNDYTYSGVISGTGGVIKSSSSSKLTLTGANVYYGSTIIDNGTLQIGNGTSGSIGNTSGVTLTNATSTLRFEPGAGMTFDKKISGSGKVEYKGSNFPLYLTADNNYSGTTTVEAGTLLIGNNSTTGSIAGDIIVNSGAYLSFCRSNDYTYSGVISGNGCIYKYCAGKLTLNGVNTFMGTIYINAGTLALGTSGSISSSGVAFEYNTASTSKFDISAGNKTIKNLSDGYSNTEIILGASTLTINGNLTLNGGVIDMDLTNGKTPKITVGGAVSATGTNTFKITADAAIANYVLMQAASGITSTTPYALNMPASMSGTLSVQSPTKLLLNAQSTGIDDVGQETGLKAWIESGILHISGLTAGETWNVYSVTGVLVHHGVATDIDVTASLPAHGVYIVQSGNSTVKVVY